MIAVVNDRERRWVLLAFSLGAVLGMVGVVQGALFAAATAPGRPWLGFFVVLLLGGSLWLCFTYGAYKGFSTSNALLKGVFWLFVVFHIFVFPIGTAIAGGLIWLWRGKQQEDERDAAR